MRSSTPKVLHEVGGAPSSDTCSRRHRDLDPERLLVVVGHGRDQVVAHLAAHRAGRVPAPCRTSSWAPGTPSGSPSTQLPGLDGTVVVTTGDTPLLTGATLAGLVAEHVRAAAAATVLTADVAAPAGLGRVVRAADGSVAGDRRGQGRRRPSSSRSPRSTAASTPSTRRRWAARSARLTHGQRPGRGVPHRRRRPAAGRRADRGGVPDRRRRRGARRQRPGPARLRRRRPARPRRRAAGMRVGVTVVDPASTWIGPDVELEPDVTLLPGVQLHGRTVVRVRRPDRP